MTTVTQQPLRATNLGVIPAAKVEGRGRGLPVSGTPVATTGSASDVVNLGTAQSLTDVARKYDVRNMSPREMAAMSQTLYQSGAISFQDHALLSFQPDLGSDFNPTLAAPPGQADAPRDLMAQWAAQLQAHEQQGDANFAKNDQRMLNILGNLAALHEASTL